MRAGRPARAQAEAMDADRMETAVAEALGRRDIVLVGMMGAGKSTVGRRLAARLGLPFVDADTEIERAAGQSIADIFDEHGETAFREGERRVLARLLAGGPKVLATGGGAFIDPDNRASIAAAGISVWLKADFDTLMRRVRRRAHRPLLKKPDPERVLRELIEARYPVYAAADITVMTRDVPHETVVGEIVAALAAHLGVAAASV